MQGTIFPCLCPSAKQEYNIHSFNIHLLRTFFIHCVRLGAMDTRMNKKFTGDEKSSGVYNLKSYLSDDKVRKEMGRL